MAASRQARKPPVARSLQAKDPAGSASQSLSPIPSRKKANHKIMTTAGRDPSPLKDIATDTVRIDAGSRALNWLLILAVFYTLYFAQSFFIPLVLALLLSFLFSPLGCQTTVAGRGVSALFPSRVEVPQGAGGPPFATTPPVQAP